MKTSLSAGLLALYAAPERTLATCWKVTRRDTQVFGFTDHDRPIVFAGIQYEAFSGYTASQVATNAQLSVDNMEVTGLLDSSGITDAELEAGIWDHAEFEIFEVNYADVSHGRNILLTGWLGMVKRSRGLFVVELRSLTSKLQNTVGDIVTPNCRYKLGDADCKVDLVALTEFDVPVTTVTSRRIFIAASLPTLSPSPPVDWFNWGVLTFTTGLNAGFSMDIKSYIADGTIELQLPFPYAVEIADEFTISPGCNKKFKTGPTEYLGDCIVKFDNGINFGGEPEVPLPNKTFRVPGS